jgi:hypothetical protein
MTNKRMLNADLRAAKKARRRAAEEQAKAKHDADLEAARKSEAQGHKDKRRSRKGRKA